MRKIKTIAALLLTCGLAAWGHADSNTVAYAANQNDCRQNAFTLTADTPYESTFYGDSSEDWYVYTVPSNEPVYFYVDTLDDTSVRWKLAVYDSDCNLVETYAWGSDFRDAYTVHGTYAAGTNIYLKLFWDGSWGIAHRNKDINYSIEARSGVSYNYTLDGKWETEDNSSRRNANELNKKTPLYGILNSNTEDYDVYKYTVAGDGKFYFQFENMGTYDGASFYVSLYDTDGNYMEAWYNESGQNKWVTPEYEAEVGSNIYVMISNKDDANGSVYQLSVIDNSVEVEKLKAPLSILHDTNVIVGYALPDATVYAQIGKKKYKAKADETGLYKIIVPTLEKNTKVKLKQKYDGITSKTLTVKVTTK